MVRIYDGYTMAFDSLMDANKRQNMNDYEFGLTFMVAFNHYNALALLRHKCYRTEEQRQLLIERYVNDINYTRQFMTDETLQRELNHKQYTQLKKLAMICNDYCTSVLTDEKERYTLNSEERQAMIVNCVAHNRLSTIWARNITTVAEDEWILTQHEFNQDTYKSFLEYTIGNESKHPLRSIAFRNVITNECLCYEMAKRDKLTDSEKVVVHERYADELSKGRTWDKYWTYCKTFKNCLTKKEQERLVKKLQNRQYIHYIPQVQQAFKLDEKWQAVLQGILVADKLRGKAV